jgi:hypothetical protein
MGLYISLVNIVTNSKARNHAKEKGIEKQIKTPKAQIIQQ